MVMRADPAGIDDAARRVDLLFAREGNEPPDLCDDAVADTDVRAARPGTSREGDAPDRDALMTKG
jgi:hypothetical protein